MSKPATRSRAKHLKIVLREIYITPVKNWLWYKIINTRHGWEKHIQGETLELENQLADLGVDIDELMNDRAGEIYEMRNDND